MKLARGLTHPCSTMHCRAQLAKNPLEEEVGSPRTTKRKKELLARNPIEKEVTMIKESN